MSKIKPRTTIAVNYDIYLRLRELGKFGQSYSDVISDLLDFYYGDKIKRGVTKK